MSTRKTISSSWPSLFSSSLSSPWLAPLLKDQTQSNNRFAQKAYHEPIRKPPAPKPGQQTTFSTISARNVHHRAALKR
jgi:hypothetical protein